MHSSSPLTRKLTRWIFSPLEAVVVSVINATLLMRLGNMQLEGLPTFVGAALALLAATTSLMFNRARAYPAGRVQRRSLLAAELTLRATFLSVVGAVLAAIIFPTLQSSGYVPTPADKLPTQAVPALLAFVPMLFFLAASLTLLTVGRVLTPTLLVRLRARHIRTSVKS